MMIGIIHNRKFSVTTYQLILDGIRLIIFLIKSQAIPKILYDRVKIYTLHKTVILVQYCSNLVSVKSRVNYYWCLFA
jgi:hypothetical protein